MGLPRWPRSSDFVLAWFPDRGLRVPWVFSKRTSIFSSPRIIGQHHRRDPRRVGALNRIESPAKLLHRVRIGFAVSGEPV